MSSFDSSLKVLVSVGLFVAVIATIVTGTMLDDAFEGVGNAGVAAEVGGGAFGLHVALAGLVGLLMLIHLVLNRKMLVFHLNHSLGNLRKK
jgi:hypothetical protein